METKQRKPQKPAAKKAPSKKAQPVRGKEQPKINADVVYLPPKPFARNRFVLHLVTVVALVIAVVMGLSVFFKVEDFSISGAEKYTPWEISQSCGVQPGDSLLLINRAKVSGKIKTALPYVKTVRVGIKLPGTVHIEIEELDVTYAAKDSDSAWWLISAGGTVVEQLQSGMEDRYTKVLGVQLQNPQIAKKAQAQEVSDTPTDAEGNPVPVTVTAADRLNTCLDILEFLEANGAIGQAASVDVNNLGDIQIWYQDKFQVKLGDNKNLGTKVSLMMATINSLLKDKPYERGVLNLTNPSDIYYDSFQ